MEFYHSGCTNNPFDSRRVPTMQLILYILNSFVQNQEMKKNYPKSTLKNVQQKLFQKNANAEIINLEKMEFFFGQKWLLYFAKIKHKCQRSIFWMLTKREFHVSKVSKLKKASWKRELRIFPRTITSGTGGGNFAGRIPPHRWTERSIERWCPRVSIKTSRCNSDSQRIKKLD